MVQLFRFELIETMFKAGVLTAEVADNLLSWRNSGFHVHATAPFKPDDNGGELLRNRLAYAFRPAVSLSRLYFDGERVRYRSRRQILDLSPVEFLAKLTLHIPDRYQNIRRYAGFYSSVVQRRVRAARSESAAAAIDEGHPVRPSWVRLIARIFGTIPIACPRCGKTMELAEFILDGKRIEAEFPELARAPPRKQFDRYVAPVGEFTYAPADALVAGVPEDENDEAAGFDQTRSERDEDLNQDAG